jgi:hypothetical protein
VFSRSFQIVHHHLLILLSSDSLHIAHLDIITDVIKPLHPAPRPTVYHYPQCLRCGQLQIYEALDNILRNDHIWLPKGQSLKPYNIAPWQTYQMLLDCAQQSCRFCMVPIPRVRQLTISQCLSLNAIDSRTAARPFPSSMALAGLVRERLLSARTRAV